MRALTFMLGRTLHATGYIHAQFYSVIHGSFLSLSIVAPLVGLNLNDRWGVAAALILRDIGRNTFRVT